jgi:RimJ/RimL family protein N-acetyltransferase
VLDLQPHLIGELVEVRPLRADDFDGLFAVASDPLLWEQHPARDRYREEVFRGFFDGQLASGGGLLVLDRRSGEAIGSSRYHAYDPERGEVEIGWTFLARSRWGGAFNGELKRLMLDHAFGEVDTVMFAVHARNLRSQRAVEKLGAMRAGVRVDAEGRPMFAYALARERWRGARA